MIFAGIGALFFAIWFVELFYGVSIGLSCILFVVPFSFFLVYILEKNKKIKCKKYIFLLIPITLLSSTYFIFYNVFFYYMNIFIIFFLEGIFIFGLLGDSICRFLRNRGIFSFIQRSVMLIVEGSKRLISDIKQKFIIVKNDDQSSNNDNKNENETEKQKNNVSIIKILPVIILIIILLSSADEEFSKIFSKFFSNFIITPLNELFRSLNHLSYVCEKFILTVYLFFCFIGLFYYLIFKQESKPKKTNLKKKIKDNSSTMLMLLISLDIIYLVFCYIQIKSLFMKHTDLVYSEYARKGFIQLMVVSVINLIVILLAKKNEKENKENNENKKRTHINCLSLVMLLFTFIIIISAWTRMYYYENAYGYTLLRLLVNCILLTEAIMFIPTILYILNIKINLLKSYFIIFITMYVLINFINLNKIIAQKNIDRYMQTKKIDIFYLTSNTKIDATEQLLSILDNPDFDDEIKSEVLFSLKYDYEHLKYQEMDYRTYNISKDRAKKLLEEKL